MAEILSLPAACSGLHDKSHLDALHHNSCLVGCWVSGQTWYVKPQEFGVGA
jgi:hypothetical protein